MKQVKVDPVSLEIFKNMFISVADEMGVTLGRTGYSPNIKERRDYSCAFFDAQGRMVSQAAHIPVHLGAMPASVEKAIEMFTFQPGDTVILNDPFLGGTHLPDITLVSPVYVPQGKKGEKGELFGFVASRAHHADVGGMSPGSMPLSTELYQEGFIIPPLKLVEGGVINQTIITLLCRNVRTPEERQGDLAAQIAASRVGERRIHEILSRYGAKATKFHIDALTDYSQRLTREAIKAIPDGKYSFKDYMDSDGQTDEPITIAVEITVDGDSITFDFTGSSPQQKGSINAVLAVTQSVCLYVVRCIVGEEVPANHGSLMPIKVIAPPGSVVNPSPPAAVSAGNVETSQRIADVLLGALAQALPQVTPAASQGTMNNLVIGGYDPLRKKSFTYYETIAGGMGARPGLPGISGIHTHMTNTMNTPVEALEFQFPFRVLAYSFREGSGGKGKFPGGDGIRREMLFLAPCTVTIMSERRKFEPYGLQGGAPGGKGRDTLRRKGEASDIALPGKVTLDVGEGDVLTMLTPGGGGWGGEEKM